MSGVEGDAARQTTLHVFEQVRANRAQIIKGDVEFTADGQQRYTGYALVAFDELGPTYIADEKQRDMVLDVFTVGVEEWPTQP